MPPKPAKRKRSRKSRTAVSSDSESSANEQPVIEKNAEVDDQDNVDLRESDLSDEAPMPEIRLGKEAAAPAPAPAHAHPRSAPEAHYDTKQAEVLLDERTREAFRQLWMQSLTDEFDDELDALRMVRVFSLTRTTRGSVTQTALVRGYLCLLTHFHSAARCWDVIPIRWRW